MNDEHNEEHPPYEDSFAALGRSASLRVVVRGVRILSMLVFTVLSFRMLSSAEYGVLATGIAILNLWLALAQSGLTLGAARKIAELRSRAEPWGDVARGVVTMSLGLSAIAGLGLLLLSIVVWRHRGELVVFASGILAVFASQNLAWAVSSVAQGIRRIGVMEGVTVVVPTLQALSVVPLLLLPSVQLWHLGVALIFAGAFAIPLIVMLGRSLQAGAVVQVFRPAYRTSVELLIYSLPLGASTIASLAMQESDVIMLAAIQGTGSVSIYQPTLKVVDAGLSLAPFLLVGLFIPIVTGLWTRGDVRAIQALYVTTTKWILVLSFPLLFVLTLFPQIVFRPLFGEAFRISETVIWILVAGYALNVVLGLNTGILVAIGDRRALLWRGVIGLLLNVSLNVALIPALGPLGAAIATAVSYVTLNIFVSLSAARRGVSPFARELGLAVVFSAVILALGAVARASLTTTGLLPGALVSAALLTFWFMLLVVSRVVRTEDRHALTSAIRRPRRPW